MSPATYQTDELAELLGVSTWTLYESIRRGEPPTVGGAVIEPIRVGRRIVWSRAKVDALLGVSTA